MLKKYLGCGIVSVAFLGLLAALLPRDYEPSWNREGTDGAAPSSQTKTEPEFPGEGMDGATPSRQTTNDLKGYSLAYFNFCNLNGRSPANIDELAPIIVSTVFPEAQRKLEEERLQRLKAGRYVVIWSQPGACDDEKGKDIVVAYEAKTAKEGGFVVFADGRVERMTPAELERTPKRVETTTPKVKLKLDLPDRATMEAELEKALKNVGDERTKNDLTSLQGLWEISGIEKSAVPSLGPAKVGDPFLVVGDKIQFKHDTWEATARFVLDATKDPKWIDSFMVDGEGFGMQGIYSLTRDEFKLCYNHPGPGSTRPEDFNMKVEYIRVLFILKRVTSKSAVVIQKAREVGQAVLKGDYAKVVDLTYPKVVEAMGGRDRMIAATEASMKQMREEGFTVRSHTVSEPTEFLTEGGNTFVVLPMTVEMTAPGGRQVARSYLLGISPDGGKTWTFVDGTGLDSEENLAVLPKLPAKLKLPEKQKPEFIKDKK